MSDQGFALLITLCLLLLFVVWVPLLDTFSRRSRRSANAPSAAPAQSFSGMGELAAAESGIEP